jgi:hypothetical protein
VVLGTARRYVEAYERITGSPFDAYPGAASGDDDPVLERLREEHG